MEFMDAQKVVPAPRRRRFLWGVLLAFGTVVLVLVGAPLLIGQLYHGPRDLAAVTAAMPGVPLFPYARIAPENRLTQRTLGLPLLIARLQGAQRADAALLLAAADRDFVLDWYRRSAPFQQWQQVGTEELPGGTRLLFLRDHEGLQITVGPTAFIDTPVQLIYLDGLTDRQVAELRTAAPL